MSHRCSCPCPCPCPRSPAAAETATGATWPEGSVADVLGEAGQAGSDQLRSMQETQLTYCQPSPARPRAEQEERANPAW